MHWWYVTPEQLNVISSIPYNLGILLVISCFMIHFINKLRTNSFIIIVLFTLLKTVLEACLLYSGKVVYGHGWNLHGHWFLI
jgi:hypothetical protein